MPARCFTCDEPGHVAADCPWQETLDNRPPWCGICDSRTRLVTVDLASGRVRRCRDCHPTAQKPLVQHKRCPACKAIIHAWDTAACGEHSVPGVRPVRQPPLPEHRGHSAA